MVLPLGALLAALVVAHAQAGLPGSPSEGRHPGAKRPESPLGHGGAPPRQAGLPSSPSEGRHGGAPPRQEAATGWSGRPTGAYAPQSLDRPGLDRHFDNQDGRREAGSAAVATEAGAQARGIRFNGVVLPRVTFTDRQPVSPLLVKAIDRTQASLRLVLYDFNQPDVLAAIQRAASRTPPVQVQILLDSHHAFPSNGRPASPEIQALLKDARLDVRVLRGLDDYGTMHNKFAIFDDKMLEYGSYNWTKAADARHYENALFSSEQRRIGLYYAYFRWMWDRSSSPTGPAPPPPVEPGPPLDDAPTTRFNGKLFPAAVFAPSEANVRWLTEAIRASAKSIDVAMFSFYEASLGDELVAAKGNGVKVRLLLDRGQALRSPVVKSLRERGMEIRLSQGRTAQFGVMHHKYAVFDGALVETGSFNWTNNARLNNFENLSFLTDADLIAEFQAEFEGVWAQATPAEALPEDAWAQPTELTSPSPSEPR